MRIFLILLLIAISGCTKAICNCGNIKCGDSCKNQCYETRCVPGEPCCDKCFCNKAK